jgi:hypothetical protein
MVMDLSSKAKERNRERPDSLFKEMNIGSSRLRTTKVQLNLARHFYLNAIRNLVTILLNKYFLSYILLAFSDLVVSK